MEKDGEILRYFPKRIKESLLSLKVPLRSLSEIHIVLGSGSSVYIGGFRTYLGINVTEGDIEELFICVTGGALYAHRETIRDGYVTLSSSVRVGICGQARYEMGELVGVCNVTSMLFRFPHGSCSFADELFLAFESSKRGTLIFAPACGGKTTALRALVKRLVREGKHYRISLIDERCEFSWEDFSSTDIDIFRGYKRKSGMQIALRVMSPQIIAVDEIGTAEEAEQMLESLGSGVRFIATAHASSIEELISRKSLRPLIDNGVFDVFAGIFNADGHYFTQIYKKDYAEAAGVIL